MAEEHRCQTPEGHRLCANNCGFFGSPATQNLCSKCYRDFCLKEEQASSAKIAVEKSLAASPSSLTTASLSSPSVILQEASDDLPNSLRPFAASTASDPAVTTQPHRCSTCRKRVGLTGFRCRCGMTFCSWHRYPEKHTCEFDFKAFGKEAIAKANPVVKAQKLEKI